MDREFMTYTMDSKGDNVFYDIPEEGPEEDQEVPFMGPNFGTNPIMSQSGEIVQINAKFFHDESIEKQLSEKQLLHLEEGNKKIVKEMKEKKTFAQIFELLKEYDEHPEIIAKKLFENEDFEIYKQQREKFEKEFEERSKLVVRNKPSLFGMIYTMMGAVVDVYFEYSHAPLLDLVNKYIQKINAYQRLLRDKYNEYDDMFQDITKEINTYQLKIQNGLNSMKYITTSFMFLIGQSGELYIAFKRYGPRAIEGRRSFFALKNE